jgi:hypothetical protein
MSGTPRLLVVFTAAVAGVVLIVLALAKEDWWLLAPALVAHGIAAALTMGYFGRYVAEGEEPADERARRETDLRVDPARVGDRAEH